MLPSVGWADVATNAYLAALEARLEASLHRELTVLTWRYLGMFVAMFAAFAAFAAVLTR